MIIDTSTLTGGETLEADICIAGAGAAGITLARKLRGAGLDVILLESGGFEITDEHQDLYRGQQVGIQTWALHEHRWRVFGGSTARWAGFCMPLSETDFTERAWIPESGWPITLDDLAPYYAMAQEDLELAGFIYDAQAVADGSGATLLGTTGRVDARMFQFSPPTRMGSLYRSELSSAEDVRVYTHANLVDIVLEAAGDRVQRFVVRTLDGAISVNVEASSFVLAMGGLENARVLLASNGEAGVANSSGRVGRFFMEHPHLYSSGFVASPEPIDLAFYRGHDAPLPLTGGGSETQRVLGVLGLSQAIRAEEGLPDLTMEIVERVVEGQDTGAIAPDAIAALNRAPLEAHRGYAITIRAEQTPLADSRLTLNGERDALGMPRVTLDWAVSEDDRRAYARSLEILGAELAASGLGRLWYRVVEGMQIDAVIQPGGHHMGTTRMHSNPARGVVDADCRAHDVGNLYLAGSSVFTTCGAANPTLTICALANRLAEHLRGDA